MHQSLTSFVLLLGLSRLCSALPQTITPGTVWRDTDGHVIQAHGGGFIQVGRTVYWFGEDHTNGAAYKDIPCYSSDDLAHWTFRGYALTQQPAGDLGPNRVVERPKVIYNRLTKRYVMYLHVDSANYSEAKLGVATSPSVVGPYTYRGSFSPRGRQSRDMTLFQDTDDTAYVAFEDRGEGGGLRIEQLAPDYLSVQRDVAVVGGRGSREAPAIVKIDGVYFLLGSRLNGWDNSDNDFVTAPSLAGPWSDYLGLAPAGTKTYNTQTAFVLPVRGRKTTSYVYVGDRWKPNDLGDSRYVWMPLTVQGHALFLPPDRPWTIDADTGETTGP